ncbi:MAG: DUF4129 domain-containing protein [Clostridia bacterium]|nr:DUF4129 domain-containing protein [Clostridia bacterium]
MKTYETFFERVFSLVSLIAISMMMVPLFIMLTGQLFPGDPWVCVVFAVLSTFLGYGIQAVMAKSAGKRPSRDGFSDVAEGTVGSFSFTNAAPALLIIAVSAVAGFFLFDWLIQLRFSFGNLVYQGNVIAYTPVYTIMATLAYLTAVIGGCVIWFYPMEQLANVYFLVTCCVLFYAELFFSTLMLAPLFSAGFSVFADASLIMTIGLPFLVFTVCMLLIFNQSNLQTRYRGSVVSVITPSARFYNMGLVMVMMLCVLLMTVICYITLSGIWLIIRMILFIIAFRWFYGRGTPESDNKVYEYVDSDEAGQMMQRNVMSPENQYLIAVFALLALAALALYIGARTGYLQKLMARLREWLRDLLDTFRIGRDIFRGADSGLESNEIYNYKDEKKLIQNAAIRDFQAMAATTDTYKLFMLRLQRLKSYEEQLCYAYAVLLRMYKKLNISLHIADTPREVEGKVVRTLPESEIREITADFERIRYAEEELSDSEAATVLNRICGVVKRYMF